MNITITECKKVFVYKNQIQRVQKEIKDFNITMNKTIVIIALNNLSLGFEIYLAIINNKARNNKKLFELGAFIKVLQEKKAHLHTARDNLLHRRFYLTVEHVCKSKSLVVRITRS